MDKFCLFQNQCFKQSYGSESVLNYYPLICLDSYLVSTLMSSIHPLLPPTHPQKKKKTVEKLDQESDMENFKNKVICFGAHYEMIRSNHLGEHHLAKNWTPAPVEG